MLPLRARAGVVKHWAPDCRLFARRANARAGLFVARACGLVYARRCTAAFPACAPKRARCVHMLPLSDRGSPRRAGRAG
eukprot:4630948-Lingulodinium_polyedra.AAC.1